MNTAGLESGLERIGIRCTHKHLAGLEGYLRELQLWNRTINLVGSSEGGVVVRHVLDSAAGLPILSSYGPETLLDVGTGAGLPGVILAIFMPDTAVTLLERSQKKCAFLQNVTALLGLKNCRVANIDLVSETGVYDVVCCRAFRPLDSVFEELAAVRSPQGLICCYKGKEAAILEELRDLETRIVKAGLQAEVIPVQVPGLPEERHLLLFRETNR